MGSLPSLVVISTAVLQATSPAAHHSKALPQPVQQGFPETFLEMCVLNHNRLPCRFVRQQ
jgi:hypothetical protein